jgi:hypothetical protein
MIEPRTGERQVRIMKRSYLFALALLATSAFAATVAGAASAEQPVWLVSGASPTAATAVVIGEELTLSAKTLLGTVRLDCSGLLDGTINALPEIDLLVTELLTLAGVQVTEEAPVECTDLSGFCPTPLIWTLNMPWLLELVLMVSGAVLGIFREDGAGVPTYHVICMGNSVTILCHGEPGGVLTNGASDVLGSFTEAAQKEDKEGGECEGFGAESAFLEGSGLIETTSGLTLAVSEE